jgi:hypothetical protein
MPNIYLVSAFWGEWHTEMFLEGCIPSLLSANNIPSLCNSFNITYLISTNRSNLYNFENNLLFLNLRKIINFEFILYDDDLIPLQNNNDQWEYAQENTRHLIGQQNLILNQALQNSFGVIYIHPDCIYSNNALEHVSEMIFKGAYLIFCPGLRVINNDIFIDYIKKQLIKKVKKYEFSELVYSNLNIYHREQFLNSKIKSKYPSAHIWSVSNGLLIREFHEKVPLFISNHFKDVTINNGLDSDYDVNLFKRAKKENKKVIYIDSSENALIASLVKEDYTLLDRWRINGNLHDPVTYGKDGRFNYSSFNTIIFYFKSYLIYHSPLQKFSSRCPYNLVINDNRHKTHIWHVFLNQLVCTSSLLILFFYRISIRVIVLCYRISMRIIALCYRIPLKTTKVIFFYVYLLKRMLHYFIKMAKNIWWRFKSLR